LLLLLLLKKKILFEESGCVKFRNSCSNMKTFYSVMGVRIIGAVTVKRYRNENKMWLKFRSDFITLSNADYSLH